MRAQRAFLRSDEGEAAGGRAHCSAQPHAAAHAHHVQARAAQVCPASRFAVNNASLLAVDPPSIRSLIAAPNPLRSFADFTALRYVGSATATSCMQKAKQLGLCDDDAPPSAARVYKPKPGSAQEAVLRALISVQAHSDGGRHSAVSSELVDSAVGSGAQRRMVRVATSNVVLAIDIETGGGRNRLS